MTWSAVGVLEVIWSAVGVLEVTWSAVGVLAAALSDAWRNGASAGDG